MNNWVENIVKSVQNIVTFIFMFLYQFLLENMIEYEKNFTCHNLSPQLLGIIEITYLWIDNFPSKLPKYTFNKTGTQALSSFMT